MKKINVLILIIPIILISTGCGVIRKPTVMVSDVTITEITFNDLDQVMIFSEHEKSKTMIFFKDFFSKSQSREIIDQEIKNCISSLSKFKGKQVSIKYYKNKHDDNIFMEIFESSQP